LGLVLLGVWGALIPFVGPYFNYAYSPNNTWTWTAARFWLEVLPGGVTFFAGLFLLFTGHRVVAFLAAWMAIAAGAWFVVGPLLAPLWRANYLGSPIGDRTDVSVEAIGMFYGLGAAIILLAALAAGRFSVVGIRDVARVSAASERTVVLPPDASTETAERPAAGVTREQPVTDEEMTDGQVADRQVADGRQPVTADHPHRHRPFASR